MEKVSVIIPGRCEQYFQHTIDSVLENAAEDIEVIAIVDEEQPPPGPLVSNDPRLKIINLNKAIGQRAAYNLGVRESTGDYVMKIDAHALLSPEFDKHLKELCGEKDVLLPEMRRLDVKKWKPKKGGETVFMYFGTDMYCHYWRNYGKRPGVNHKVVVETMTGQGSCWFCRREWNDHIGLLDERVGSWGNVGIEVSLRTWLCGGRQTATKKVWQAHFFRKDEGGFPYHLTGRHVAKAHRYTRENYYFKDNAFKNQTLPFKWLIERFSPPQWEAYLAHDGKVPAYVLYYTDNRLEEGLASAVRKQLERVCGTLQIYSVSKKPLNFGKNVCVGEIPHCYKSMYEGIKKGLEAIPGDPIVYLVEHDVFYHPSHFTYIPQDKKLAYFNTNRYYWSTKTDFFYPARGKWALSQGVAYKSVWMNHVTKRLEIWDSQPDNKIKIDFKNYESSRPNVDVRHGDNMTPRGHYKKNHEAGKLKNTYNLPGWGRIPHFTNTVKYHPDNLKKEKDMDTAQALHNKWRRILPQPSPVRCRQFTRKDLAGLIGRLGLKKGAEIGVRDGTFSEVLCQKIPDIELSCIDPWCAYYHFSENYGLKNYKKAEEKLSKYNAKLIKATSLDAIAAFGLTIEDNSLDFVYIDGDHRFDAVMLDLILWGQKVRPGGIIAGHDYYRFRNGGVVPAVDVYTHCHYINEWFITDEKEATFFFVKPELID